MPNEPQGLLNDARDQLNLVLGFFSRVDAKASVVLAIDTGMLAVLASNAPPLHKMSVLAGVAAVITVLIIAASLWDSTLMTKLSMRVLSDPGELVQECNSSILQVFSIAGLQDIAF